MSRPTFFETRGSEFTLKLSMSISRAQDSNQCYQRGAVASFQIDRDDIELRQNPPEHRHIHQRFFCEKKNGSVAGVSSQWRVKKTLVIHGQNHRAGLNDALS